MLQSLIIVTGVFVAREYTSIFVDMYIYAAFKNQSGQHFPKALLA